MDEMKVQMILSSEVLLKIQDGAIQDILTKIIFSNASEINWKSAYSIIMHYMPELELKEEYKRENLE